MTVWHGPAGKWRARIALCAAFLMVVSVADSYLCGSEAEAHGAVTAAVADDHAHDAGDPGESDCAYGHCHHVVPMPAAAAARLSNAPGAVFERRPTAAFRSALAPPLDHPPKA